MFDITKMMPMAAKMMGLNDHQISNLKGAVNKARSLMDSSSSPIDAFHKSGIDNSFLQQIKGGLDNPRYEYLLQLLGMNKADAKTSIDELSSAMSNPSTSSNNLDIDVEKFKRYL